MKCLQCNSEMVNDTCIRCGYMSNGNIANTNRKSKKEIENDNIKKVINDKNEYFFRRFNIFAFFFKSFYLLYRKCYVIGYLLLLIEYFLFYIISPYDDFLLINFLIMPIIKGILYYTFTNSIYLIVIKKKLSKMSDKDITNYKSTSFLAPFIGLVILSILILNLLYTNNLYPFN